MPSRRDVTTYLNREKVLQISVALPGPDASNNCIQDEHSEIELSNDNQLACHGNVREALTCTFGCSAADSLPLNLFWKRTVPVYLGWKGTSVGACLGILLVLASLVCRTVTGTIASSRAALEEELVYFGETRHTDAVVPCLSYEVLDRFTIVQNTRGARIERLLFLPPDKVLRETPSKPAAALPGGCILVMSIGWCRVTIGVIPKSTR